MLDIAVDYAVEMEEIKATDAVMSGEATYRETMERMAAVHAARSAYYSLEDVIASIPTKDASGRPLDPRLRFAPVATAQGMAYLAKAGYDVGEAENGWRHLWRINNRINQENERVMGAWGEQMRAMQGLMEQNMMRMQQQLGATGLVQTLSEAPESKALFVSKLTGMKEVLDAQAGTRPATGKTTYRQFLQGTLAKKAETSLEEEDYEKARIYYRILYDKGVQNAAVAYGMAKSQLGDFAFGASTVEKKAAERQYREALKLDPRYAPAYRGLGELYEDWERYQDAADAYGNYVRLAPNAQDRKRIQRKIKTMKRKANR
jgi:tetratricopeptide (TPR) repeat protein